MKALVRDDGEIVTDEDGVEWIDWKTGMPLTNPHWKGGRYTLVDDYVPPQCDENGEIAADSSKSAEITELRARLAALEKDM